MEHRGPERLCFVPKRLPSATGGGRKGLGGIRNSISPNLISEVFSGEKEMFYRLSWPQINSHRQIGR